MAVTLSVTVASVCSFWAMPNLAVLAVVIYLSGMTIAPTLIAGFSLLEEQAPPGRSTEAMAWLSTGISVGVACGSAATGFVLDAFGPRWGYAFAGACGVTAALIYVGGIRRVSGSAVSGSAVSGSAVSGSAATGSAATGSAATGSAVSG
jgi:predicted MFS family arabinose efflux permease